MAVDDLILHVFCLIDDTLKALSPGRLRQRGPAPALADSEVITMELVGELLGLDRDKAIYRHFRAYHLPLFPALGRISRTTFGRQAANLWAVKRLIHRRLAEGLLSPTPDAPLWVLDSFPLPVCRFARAPACRRFAGLAANGFDHTENAVYYGLRIHLCCSDRGIIGELEIAPANVHDSQLVEELLPLGGVGLGDRNYWDPALFERLRAEGRLLMAPFRRKSTDPWPRRSALLSRLRQVIEPVIGQLAERLNIKRTWARDLWHLCSRLLRKVLAHTVAVLLNVQLGHPPLALEQLMPE